MSDRDAERSDRDGVLGLALIGLFVTALVTAQLLAVKLVPVSVPGFGEDVLVPSGVLAYAVTFFATDCYAELYGRRRAQMLVNVGFAMIVVMLALVWSAIAVPGSPAGVDPDAFASVMGPSTNVVVGGLLAYVVSQNWDVIAFHRIREFTDGRKLWLRNVGSTATSQAVDTVIFVSMAFFVLPRAVGIGPAPPLEEVAVLILGQYAVKLLIAVVDTPFVYAVVGAAGSGRDSTVGSIPGAK